MNHSILKAERALRSAGCSAYAPHPETARSAYIGPITNHNVYIGEVAALALALQMAIDEPAFHQNINIFSDNQSALQVIRNPRQSSG